MTIDEFIEKTCARSLPQNPLARVRTLAKELAEGALEGLWNAQVDFSFYSVKDAMGQESTYESPAAQYLRLRWNSKNPEISLLEANGYQDQDGKLTKAAFDLLNVTEPATIFISYKRSESSAFAMYVLSALKHAGLEAFVDLSITPGENWQHELEGRIKNADYFILLIGQDTLSSGVSKQELEWAIKYDRKIIPVWHNKFSYQSGGWLVSEAIDRILTTVHTVRVLDESALGYFTAITQLLNRFGITPE